MANPSEEQKFEPRLQQAPVDNNITIEFMFAGINMFWARLRLITKMSLRRAQNIFMPKNLNSITIDITLEGIEEITAEKNDKTL